MRGGRTPLYRAAMRHLVKSTPEWMERREFLRRAGAAGAAAVMGGCTTRSGREGRAPDGPIAIVGAGLAGLTCAYRLSKRGATVHLYEGAARAGGRVHTRRGFNADGMFVELGAELVDTNHRDLLKLARELGLKAQSLVAGETGQETFWFDGRAYTEKDVLAAFRPLGVRIAADASGLYDRRGEYTAKARQLDAVSLGAYLRDRGEGVAPWVVKLLVAAYEPEFGLPVEEQSALNLVDFINPDSSKHFEVFGDSDEAWRLEGGNDRLPTALHRALGERGESVDLRFGHRLEALSRQPGGVGLAFRTSKGLREHAYERVVLALPFSVLRGVRGLGELGLSDEKLRCIREMGYGANVKVFRGFSRRVWRQPIAGRDFLANGSLYAEQPSFQNVWETSRGQDGQRGVLTNYLGARRARDYETSRMRRFLDDLEPVFPGVKAAYDGSSGAMDWVRMPWARGSYSCPRPGQYTWIYETAGTPELGGRLLFAGEHTSIESAGFMNGAVESGIRAAREALA